MIAQDIRKPNGLNVPYFKLQDHIYQGILIRKAYN